MLGRYLFRTNSTDGNSLSRLCQHNPLQRLSTFNVDDIPGMPNIRRMLAGIARLEPIGILGIALIIEPIQRDRLRGCFTNVVGAGI